MSFWSSPLTRTGNQHRSILSTPSTKKTIFESSSSEDDLNAFTNTNIRNGSESVGTNSSSSDDFRPMDDFKPLIKRKKPIKSILKRTNNIEQFREDINSRKLDHSKHVEFDNGDTNIMMTQIQREHSEQDEVLGDMSVVLQRLEIMSKDIGNEIVEQDQMLEETQQQADFQYDRMKRIDKMLTALMEQNGMTPCRVIMALGCIVVVLIILILLS